MALEEKPIRPSGRLRDLVLGSVDLDSRFEGFVDRLSDLFDIDTAGIRNLLAKVENISDIPWQSSIIPGVRILKFAAGPKVAAAACGLVYVKPGRIFPTLQHKSDEWVPVFQGRAQEDSGRILRPGDLCRSPAGSIHTFRTLGREPFVFAVLLYEDNKWMIGQTLIDYILPTKRFGKALPDQ